MSSASVAQEGSGAGEIELYDELFEKFKEGRVFEAPAFADTPDQPKEVPKVDSLDFHNSEPLLVSVTDKDAGIRLYNIEKGMHERSYFSAKYGASLVRFTHHPAAILYASTRSESTLDEVGNHAIRYHSLHDNTYLRYFKGHTEEVVDIGMSSVSDTFFSASVDRTIKRWDLRTEGAQATLDLKVDQNGTFVDCIRPRVAVDRSDEIIAVATEGGNIHLFDTANLDNGPFYTILGQETGLARPRIICLKLSNQGNLVAVALQNRNVIYVHRTDTQSTKGKKSSGESAQVFETGLSVDKLEFDFTPDDKYLVCGCGNGEVKVWSLESGNGVAKLSGGGFDIPDCLKWSPRHALFATGSSKLSLWLPDT